MRKLGNPAITLAAAGLMLFLGAKGVSWVVRDTMLVLGSSSWVTAPAIVESSALNKSHQRGGARYSPRVTYLFEANGQTYRGTRFEIPTTRGFQADERRRLAPYSPGARIVILYDPADPTRSVVNRPVPNYWFTFGTGSIPLCAAALGVYTGWTAAMQMRRRRNKSLKRTREDQAADASPSSTS